ncbi:HeH/LEM domain-containing protein [Pseudomonas corrugata]
MPTISVTKPFPFAVDGNEVIQIDVGEQEVSDRCALVAVEHLGYATLLDDDGGTETDPLKMTVPKLKEWLAAKGIEFDAGANKATLQALVPSND